ncbi:GAF and ANTAR domain-containing protein [Cryobacterium sp. PAMC25264]|uniref:GAF and ANTAR domain-containing protein n=1 Tax=Cryobacterium sp. PAMC25264 TaxID=2861288 RepID=UPI001C63A7A4|nr:GAF and ANTAR domain-containing protein [Cryobacterium sp. PAMC25264]QYF74368.1 GAF and ANTAR domain-containing protein [Cryobacterium sp. PAMC25264]
MDGTSREARITAAFVMVADTLTTEYDMVDLLHTLVEECAGILKVKAGGLMLVDGNGDLQLMTSTSEAAEFVEMMQLDASDGPCIDCFRSGKAVSVEEISMSEKWPLFQKAASAAGFRSVLATPLKLHAKVIGTMNLFGTAAGEVSERDAAVAQALADVATIGILQERVIREGHLIEEQLHRALDSRILIEQAKGVVANELSMNMDEAFLLLRKYARDRNMTIRTVADQISNRHLTVQKIAAGIHR